MSKTGKLLYDIVVDARLKQNKLLKIQRSSEEKIVLATLQHELQMTFGQI